MWVYVYDYVCMCVSTCAYMKVYVYRHDVINLYTLTVQSMMMRQVWMMTITKEVMSCTEQLLVDTHFFIRYIATSYYI